MGDMVLDVGRQAAEGFGVTLGLKNVLVGQGAPQGARERGGGV